MISAFYGILIQIFWRDHAPRHFHALYAEHDADRHPHARCDRGQPAAARVGAGAGVGLEHRAELMEDWDLCNRMQTPKKIAPLS
jgi:hypothetical protein